MRSGEGARDEERIIDIDLCDDGGRLLSVREELFCLYDGHACGHTMQQSFCLFYA